MGGGIFIRVCSAEAKNICATAVGSNRGAQAVGDPRERKGTGRSMPWVHDRAEMEYVA